MARLHVGTTTTLEAVPAASCSNGDIAYIWLNGYTRKMIYNSTATYATDTSNHPYKQRPSDYGAAGVWVEDIGADQPEVWSMDQIKTGELIIADDGSIHTDSKTSYADTDAGFWFGYDSTAHKINFGNANSYIKWSGAAMAIKMASGETFDLYGSMNIYDGGDITLNPSDTDPALIKWGAIHNLGAASTTARGLCIWPETANQEYFAIGYDPVGDAYKQYLAITFASYTALTNLVYRDANNQAKIFALASGALSYIEFTVEFGGAEHICQLDAEDGAFFTSTSADLGTTLGKWKDLYLSGKLYIDDYILMADNKWIGLGAAKGRIEFDNQATDEINFLDCNVGIGTETPAAPLHLAIDDGALTLAVIEQAKAATNGIFALRAPAGQATNLYFQESTTSKAGIRWDGSNSRLEFWVGNVGTEAIRIQNDGDVGFGGVSPAAQVHIDQSASDGAKPVITVDQADISEEFIKFIGSAANGVLTQSIVDEGDQGSATLAGWLKISVEDVGDQVTDGAYHIPFYTLAA